METRQEKEPCITQLSSTTSFTPQTQLYFALIPADVVMAIIRQISKRPYAPYWQSHVDCTEAQNVLRCGGIVTEIAQTMFSQLSYGNSQHRESFGSECSSLRVSKETDLSRLLLDLGPRLRSLTFETRLQEFDFYVEKCTQLRELTVKDWCPERPGRTVDRILKSCGHSLTHLNIYGSGQMRWQLVRSITNNCSALESLLLNDQTVLDVEMEKFWQVIGRTLKRLRCLPSMKEQALEFAERHCKLLEDVEIITNPLCFPFVQFYENLGAQLRMLRLNCFVCTRTPEVMAQILDKCPNVLVDVSIRGHEKMLSVLCGRVRKLELSCISHPSVQFATMANAFTALTELRLNNLRSNSLKFAMDLFNSHLPNLAKLSVDDTHAFQLQGGALVPSLSVLDVVACNVHSLREFECRSSNPLDPQSFKSLLDSNRDLRRFTLTYFSDGDTVSNTFFVINSVFLVQSLVQYSSVHEFEVCLPYRKIVSNQIRNACVPLRGRQLNLIVGEVQYLPTFLGPI